MGVTPRGELSAFGGRREDSETLLATLVREYVEESHEVLISISEFIRAVPESSVRFVRPSRNGNFSFTCVVRLEELDFAAARARFQALFAASRKHAFREMVDIVQVDVAAVRRAVREKTGQVGAYRLRPAAFHCLSLMHESLVTL